MQLTSFHPQPTLQSLFMQKPQPPRSSNSTYSLDGVMQYLNQQVRTLTEKQSEWDQERMVLLGKIKKLESQLQRQCDINMQLQKKMKHRRSSSEDKTVIFNQTNISSYYPIIMLAKGGWVSKQNLRSHMDSVRTLTWYEDFLISSGEDSLVKIWQSSKPELINTVREHLGPVFASARYDNFVFTGGLEGVVRQWEFNSLVTDEGCYADKEIHTDVIWDLQHHPTEKLLLSSSADGTIKLTSTHTKGLANKAEFKRKIEGGLDIPTSVEWLGNMFSSGFRFLTSLLIYDIETQKPYSQLRYNTTEACSQPNKIKYSEYSKFIISAHEDKYLRFFDPKSCKMVKQLVAHTDSVSCVSFQSNSPQFCSSSHDGSVRCWDMRNYKCLNDLPLVRKKFDEGANVVLHHPTKLLMAVGGADGIIKVLEAE